MKRVLIVALATVVGYTLMVVLITLVQEVWFGGVGWGETPLPQLTIAGLLTMLSGFVGAWVGSLIARVPLPAWIMAGLVCVETTVLITTGRITGPLWFDLAAAASLVAAILAGGWLWGWRSGSMGFGAVAPVD